MASIAKQEKQMRYEKFEDWMTGQRIVELGTGDLGKNVKFYGSSEYPDIADKVWAEWENTEGQDIGGGWIYLDKVRFINPPEEHIPEMILEMNGKRYRLVEIKE